MMNRLWCLSFFLWPAVLQAELIGLDEAELENVSGQTGIGITIDKQIDIGSVSYSDDGVELQVQGIQIGSPTDVANTSAYSNHLINVDGDDGLIIESVFEPTRIQVGGISIGSHIGSNSFGEFLIDFEGSNILQIDDNAGAGLLVSSTSVFENVNFVWRTNDNGMRFENMTINSELTDALINEVAIDPQHIGLNISIPAYNQQLTLAGVCFSDSACTADNSFGAISVSQALTNSQIQIHGGGRNGEGLTMNMVFEFDESVNTSGDGNAFSYTDEATLKMAKQSRRVSVSGFTFDIESADSVLGDHIAMQWDNVSGYFRSDLVEIADNIVGAFEIQFEFSDGTHDGVDYNNQLKIAPGIAFAQQDFSGDAGLFALGFDGYMTNFYSKVDRASEGVSVFNQWNVTADVFYEDDTHQIMIDNIYAYGDGYATFDIRAGSNSIDSSNDVNENFLAIGIRNHEIHYGFDGLRVGSDTAQLQNGYEFLGAASNAHFTLNGLLEIRGGGASGSGLTIDADMLISDGQFTLTKSGNVGIHLDQVNYEFHLRDTTLDVNNQGLQMVMGEFWSEFSANEVRFGDGATGNSLGGIAMTQYEQGSSITINGGGAVFNGCTWANGVDEVTCHSNGGAWLETGSEGLNIESQRILLQENLPENKSNSVTVEMNRSGGISATGQSLKLNNIHTTDGYDDSSNTFGVQQSLSVDIARTQVLKKEDGADINGIVGGAGDEVVTTGAGATDYTYVSNPDAAQRAARPETLVLTHNVQFKELNVGSVELIHGPSATSTNMLQGIKLQNLNLTSRLMVSPIR